VAHSNPSTLFPQVTNKQVCLLPGVDSPIVTVKSFEKPNFSQTACLLLLVVRTCHVNM